MKLPGSLPRFTVLFALSSVVFTAGAETAADSINLTGLELQRRSPSPNGNALISPWSVQNVMAMVFAGAAGETRREMNSALHFGGDPVHASFKELNKGLAEKLPAGSEVRIASRLFPSLSCKLLPAFSETLTANYGSAVESLDFNAFDKASAQINSWVSEQTGRKINDLIPKGALNAETRLVLTNAVYFNVPWQVRFTKELTTDQPFAVATGMQKTVPLMFKQTQMRYAKKKGFQIAVLPYTGEQLQLVVIVPDKADGLAEVEKALTPALLAGCASMPKVGVRLSLPRFRMEPPAVELQLSLAALGIKTAFSADSADFTRMSAEKLFISKVFHKTFIEVNEDGTEAAAATAAEFRPKNGHPHEAPHETVRADHPFVFAIQHVPSGACLFLGRLVDPDPAKTATPKSPAAKPSLKK